MSLIENITMALEGPKSNKMRSFLTMLGIIIGIASVIGIVTLGDALSKSVSNEFDSIGSTSISFYVSPKGSYSWDTISSRDYIPKRAIDSMTERFGSRIKSITLTGAGSSAHINVKRDSVPISIQSTTPGSADFNKIEVLSGRFLTDEDISKNREVAVISDKVVEEVYEGRNELALGGELLADTDTAGFKVYTIVGVYKYEPQGMIMGGPGSGEPVTTVYIPLTVGDFQFGAIEDTEDVFERFILSASDRNDIGALRDDVKLYLETNYYSNNDRAEISAESLQSQLSQINEVMDTIKVAISAIAAISLVVGGIGVMNILLVSVTERTREIGIRKALGATNTDIRTQFITESIIICIIGGIIGVLIGGIGSYILSTLLITPTLPSLFSITIAVSFSMFIGIFFGYYPANKAAKLNPIDALRYE